MVKTIFICQSCSYESPHWLGQCPQCQNWNTLVETSLSEGKNLSNKKIGRKIIEGRTVKLSDIKSSKLRRIKTGIGEFDRVLGGGFVDGQVVLIAGAPGIGKSTLLTQIAENMDDGKVLYVCGEESPMQIKIRAERMGYKKDNLILLNETNSELITAVIEQFHKQELLSLIIIDSIQTLLSEEYTGMAGSVGQIKGSTSKIIDISKKYGIPVILVGHVTKEGAIAGPMVLEHMVDTVLYLEGDSSHLFRILKTTKNRFGPVSEVGIFEMSETGMREISNASEYFLRESKNSSGVCPTAAMEGFRPIMFEVQALAVKTSFGYPKRTASGYNINRLYILIATLEKRCQLKLSEYDIYLSISGGYKLTEYSCDLSVCLALASAVKDIPIKASTAAFGECDLSGGIRRVPFESNRIKECNKLGYTNIISSKNFSDLNQAIRFAFL